MTDQMTNTNTEPARPDLEGIDELIYAYAATASPMPPGSVIYYLAQLADYVRKLESELVAMTADRDALIAASIEETARADRAETQLNALVDAVCSTVERSTDAETPGNRLESASVAFHDIGAANLSPEQSADAENGNADFSNRFFENRSY